MYITEDVGDIYVDISSTERIRLNAESAEKLRKITYNADGSKKSEVFVDYDYILGLASQISDLNTNIANKSTITVKTWENATSPSTSEQKASFTINRVKDDTTYEAMETNNLIDPDQIYLVEGPDNKMDKHNPVGTGSFSMNRLAGIVTGEYSHAEGYNATASGTASHAEGDSTIASGNYSHAEGYGHSALLHLTGSANSTTYEVIQGSDLCRVGGYVVWGPICAKIVDIGIISGTLTMTITLDTTLNPEQDFEDTAVSIYRNGAFGEASHAEGYGTVALGKASHAEGYDTIAYNDYSHAEGGSTVAEGDYSHAEGHNTKAEGDYSHAEGGDTYAPGDYSHAEGDNTVAWGTASHAEGYEAGVTGDYSHVEGYGTIASGWCQHVQGEFNIEDDENINMHIVGNGWDKDTRSNAHTLDWDGNAWFAGDVYVHSTSGTNKDEGSKKLATEEYVTNNLSNAGGAFYAAYGTTTNAEIKAAYDAGKVVLCAYETRIYRLYTIPTGSDTIYFTSEHDYDGESDRLRYLSVSTSDAWSSTFATDSSFSSAKYYNGSTTVSSSTGYYRPIRVSTAEPTASDGNVGDIWIQYSL